MKKTKGFKDDWRIKSIQKANSDKKLMKKTLKGLKKYRKSHNEGKKMENIYFIVFGWFWIGVWTSRIVQHYTPSRRK